MRSDRSALDRENGLNLSAAAIEPVLVVEHLSEPKSDLTCLVRPRETLHLNDSDPVGRAPCEVEVWVAGTG
jgi:hypothetical protein